MVKQLILIAKVIIALSAYFTGFYNGMRLLLFTFKGAVHKIDNSLRVFTKKLVAVFVATAAKGVQVRAAVKAYNVVVNRVRSEKHDPAGRSRWAIMMRCCCVRNRRVGATMKK